MTHPQIRKLLEESADLPVGDLAESLRHVREGGGKVIKETRGTDGNFASAVVQDPVGAWLALVPG